MPGFNQLMVPTDDKTGYAKTSLKMTRSMSNDIGLKVKKVLQEIADGTVDLSHTEWQWLVSQCWSDDIWIDATVKAIEKTKRYRMNLNKNPAFLQLISELTPSQLKAEFKKTHPICRLSLMDLVNKKQPKKEMEHTYEDLWLNPQELAEKRKKQREEQEET